MNRNEEVAMSGTASTVLLALGLLLTAGVGTAVVLTEDPVRQAVTLSVFGVVLAVLFAILQGPDVALSQLVVGTAVVPLLVLLAIRKTTERPDAMSESAASESKDRPCPDGPDCSSSRSECSASSSCWSRRRVTCRRSARRSTPIATSL